MKRLMWSLMAAVTIIAIHPCPAAAEEIEKYFLPGAIGVVTFKPHSFLQAPLVKSRLVDAIAEHAMSLLEGAKSLDDELKSLIAQNESTLKEFFADRAAMQKLCNRAAEDVESISVVAMTTDPKDAICIFHGNIWESCFKQMVSKAEHAPNTNFSKTVLGESTLYAISLPNGRQLFVVVPEEKVVVFARNRAQALKVQAFANGKVPPKLSETLSGMIKSVDSKSQFWICCALPDQRFTVSMNAATDFKLHIQLEDVAAIETIANIAKLGRMNFFDVLMNVPAQEKTNLEKMRTQIIAVTEFNRKGKSITFNCKVNESQIGEFFRLLQWSL